MLAWHGMEWMASKTMFFFQKIQLIVELLSFSIFSSFILKGLTGDFWPARRVWTAHADPRVKRIAKWKEKNKIATPEKHAIIVVIV